MWPSWRRALFDPAGLLADGEPPRRHTAGVLAATTIVCLLPAPLKVYAFRSDAVSWNVMGTYPRVVYAVSDASIGVPGLYAILLVVGLIVPTVCALLYGGVFHVLSTPSATAGTYRDTVAVTIWGLLPTTVAGALALAVLYATVAITGPIPVVTGINFPGRVVVAPLDRSSPWILLDLLVTASLCWTGVLWARGLAAARGISTWSAIAVVLPPLTWTLLTTIAGQIVVVEIAGTLVNITTAG